MKHTVNILILTLLISLGFQSVATAVLAPSVNNEIYAQLLSEHVHDGKVDYHGFKQDETLLDQYLDILSRTEVSSLSQTQKFAFYINAYNAFTIKLVLTKYPQINSIKELGGFFSSPWKIKFIPLDGQTISLDHIEHEILRPTFKDPRVHFAINCASKSCPPLLNMPYAAEQLDAQLNQQVERFINDEKNTVIKGKTLFISKIFKWFKEDFNDDPTDFITPYLSAALKGQLERAEKPVRIEYMDYDWSLNQWRNLE